MRNRLLSLTAAATLLAGIGCTVGQQSAPGTSGPSEFAMSLKMAVTPDRILQDGAQFSRVNVTVLDATGKAVARLVHLDAEAVVGGVTQAFGTLSANTLSTSADANNPASVTYVPPPTTSGSGATVTIRGTLVGADSVTESTQQVSITVTPSPGGLAQTVPVASFTTTPQAPATALSIGTQATFDASASCGGQLVAGVCSSASAIISYSWNFGDATLPLSGKTVTRSYAAAGTYTVTLTVTNAQNVIASSSQSLVVASATSPTAAFVFSPTSPITHAVTSVNFNAATSTATAGHPIVRYDWNFGDSVTATTTSSTTSHIFNAAGTFVVTLTVIDDTGTAKAVSSSITVS